MQHVSASAKNYNVFCMLEDALADNRNGGSLRASIAPSHGSSTNGPFKMNSWKMQTESKPLIDLKQSGESNVPGQQQNLGRSASASTHLAKRTSNVPVLNCLSLPVDNRRTNSHHLRPERFTLEGVREEHAESFPAAYPHKEVGGKVDTPPTLPAAVPPAGRHSVPPRRWSVLRMFSSGKKGDSTASPATPTTVSAGGRSGASAGALNSYTLASATPYSIMHGVQAPLQPSASLPQQQDSIRSGITLHEPHNSSTQHRTLSGNHTGWSGAADPHQFATPDTTPMWYTPAANTGTPSFITPAARPSALATHVVQTRDMLQAAQQATPEQARAVLQKFHSIRQRQRAQTMSALAPGL
jgi:hypothetical protein